MGAAEHLASPEAPGRRWADVGVRLLVALPLIAVTLAAVWAGSIWYTALIILCSGLILWEWTGITLLRRLKRIRAVLALICAGAFAAAHGHDFKTASLIVLLASVTFAAVAVAFRSRSAVWAGGGLLYGAVATLALLWIRDEPHGLYWTLWLFASVWATDTGAYFAGRLLGGPKLAPRFSPKKTWSGLAGGMVLAGVAGACFAPELTVPVLALAGLSMAIAVLAQVGDIGESALKRRFDRKDASRLLPGHGGLMDRVDGLITTAPVVALALWVWG